MAANRFKALGKKARREKLAYVIARTGGRLKNAAYQLGVARSWLYVMIENDELWPLVNAARERRLEDLMAAKAATRHGDAWQQKKKWRWFYGRTKADLGKK